MINIERFKHIINNQYYNSIVKTLKSYSQNVSVIKTSEIPLLSKIRQVEYHSLYQVIIFIN